METFFTQCNLLNMQGQPDLTPLDKIVGENVKRIRTARNIKQHEFAEAIGCTQSHLSLLESGRRAWKNKLIWDASKALEVDPSELFGGMPVAVEDRPIVKAIIDRMGVYSALEKKS